MEKSDLLQQLRIDRSDERPRARGSRLVISVVVALLALIAVAAGGWWFLRGGTTFEVEAATAVAPTTNGSGSLAVL